MSASGHSQASLHAFMHPTPTETRPQSLLKRPREDSPTGSEFGAEEPDNNRMDFQHAEHITSTQAIGDDNTDDDHELPQLAPPLSPEHAALRADFEIITAAAMENLYSRITADIAKSASDATIAFQKTTDQLARHQGHPVATTATDIPEAGPAPDESADSSPSQEGPETPTEKENLQ